MLSRSEVARNTKTSINYRDNFAQFLTESERSAYTIKNYLGDLDGFALWLKSKRNEEFTPELITPTDLREYKHYLDETLQLKPKTINRKLSSLRSFLNWAGIKGYFSDNRLPHVPQPIKEQASAPKWLDRLSQYDLCRVVEKGRKTRDIAIVKLLLNTGLRVSELCALTWKDLKISPKKGRLSVNHGKGAKRRTIPLNKDARSVLLELGYSKNKGSDQRVFIGQRGAMTPRGIESTLRKYVKQTDLEEVSPHQLRHTFCNLLGFALQLGTLRFLGFIPDNFPHLPSDVVEYVAQQLNISVSVLSLYGERSQTRTNQLQEIQDYLGWSKPTATDYQKLAAWLLQRAMEHDRPLLLLQLLIKKLETSKIMRPGLTVLERMVATARNEAWIETYNCLKPILS